MPSVQLSQRLKRVINNNKFI